MHTRTFRCRLEMMCALARSNRKEFFIHVLLVFNIPFVVAILKVNMRIY